MAINLYVNKVKYGDQTVMDISDTTAQENNVAEGAVFYKGTGERAIGTGNYYSPNDTTETVAANILNDSDLMPFYDTSETSKKNSTWANIKAKLNEIFFKRSENNILGAKNFVNYDHCIDESTTSHELTSTGIRIYTTSDGEYKGTYLYLPDYPKLTALKLTTNIVVTSGCGLIKVQGSDDNSNWVEIATTSTSVVDIDINLDISASNYLYYRLSLYCTAMTSDTGDVTFNNLMLRLASDPDNTFVSYAMTNKELTNKKPTTIELTQSEYDALTTAEKNDPSKMYMVTNDDTTNINWGDIYGSISNQTDLNNLLTEITPTFFSQILLAGDTSVTFTNLPTTTADDYVASFYTSNGANYLFIDTSITGQVTITYEVQNSDITVYLKLEKIQ